MIVLNGRRVLLRPLSAGHYEDLYQLLMDPTVGTRLRYRGGTPSPDAFVAHLWDDVLAQFAVEMLSSRELIGMFVLSSANLRDRYAYFSTASISRVHLSGLMMEALFLGLDYAFSNWDFRKLYAEVMDQNLAQFRSATKRRWLVEEGRLRDHQYFEGAYRDVSILAVHRSTWEERAPRVRRLLTGFEDASPREEGD